MSTSTVHPKAPAKVAYSFGGTPRDFVELPSQINEQWVFTRELLDRFGYVDSGRTYVIADPREAWLLAVVAHLARQPLVLAYLVAGFVLGPSGLKWVKSEHSINTIAELGLIFMLFMIGLEIDLKKIVRAGKVIITTATAQIFGCFVLGILFFLLIGLPLGGGRFDALYLAMAVSLSSTVIIVKILYDKFELDTLPGRITLGVLVLQDLFAILFLAVQPNLGNLQLSILALSVLRVVVLVGGGLGRGLRDRPARGAHPPRRRQYPPPEDRAPSRTHHRCW